MPAKKQSQTPAVSPATTPADPLAQLGAARPHWDKYLSHAASALPGIQILWKTYAGKTGRQCVIRIKDRNLVYLKPADGAFLASTALSDAAVATLADSSLPKSLIDEITSSPKYPEGRPARISVHSAATLKTALALLSIKTADVNKPKSNRLGRKP